MNKLEGIEIVLKQIRDLMRKKDINYVQEENEEEQLEGPPLRVSKIAWKEYFKTGWEPKSQVFPYKKPARQFKYKCFKHGGRKWQLTISLFPAEGGIIYMVMMTHANGVDMWEISREFFYETYWCCAHPDLISEGAYNTFIRWLKEWEERWA